MTCTKCKQPIKKGEKYHRTKVGQHHRECQRTPIHKLGVPPPVLIMDGFQVFVSPEWTSGTKRLTVRQYAEDTMIEVARIHITGDLAKLLAAALLKGDPQ